MVAAVRCRTCDTVATNESWRSGGRATTDAPSEDTIERTSVKASSSVPATGVSTQVAPSNRSARDPSTPSSSEPAMGWPPT